MWLRTIKKNYVFCLSRSKQVGVSIEDNLQSKPIADLKSFQLLHFAEKTIPLATSYCKIQMCFLSSPKTVVRMIDPMLLKQWG